MHLTARRIRRGLLFAAVVVLVVLIAVFVRAYRGAAPPAGTDKALGAPTTRPALPSVTPGPGSSTRTTDAGLGGGLQIPHTLPPYTITPAENPGFVIAPIPKHRLVMTVTSAQTLPRLGYIVPTSPDHSYGNVAVPGGTRWTLRTTVTGKPYYAALFVQAGASGTPVTCTISLDGVVKDTKTTTGPYGRQVCLA
jgi:hypothetical protein